MGSEVTTIGQALENPKVEIRAPSNPNLDPTKTSSLETPRFGKTTEDKILAGTFPSNLRFFVEYNLAIFRCLRQF